MDPDDTKLAGVRESRTISFLKKTNFQGRENDSILYFDKGIGIEKILANRRFKAEDTSFNPDQIPSLKELVVQQIIENFPCKFWLKIKICFEKILIS